MKKLYESPLQGWDETASSVAVYEIEDEEEYQELLEIDFMDDAEERHNAWLDLFGFYEAHNVMPGARYERYGFVLTNGQVIVTCTVSYNV